jgi:hypothetical protein
MKKKDLWFLTIIFGLIGTFASCDISDRGLGTDILPPGDQVIVHQDTIFDIDAYTIEGKPVITSEYNFSAGRLMLLGSLNDSIFGRSEASVVTQFNTTGQYKPAENLEIDSLTLNLYFYDFQGDTEQDINLSVYEFTERIYLDSGYNYYSDYDIEGKYNPVPLVQQTITPESGHTYKLLIQNQDFIDKFLAIQSDTNYFNITNDSIFKDYFNGFYITAEPVSSEGTMARIQLASSKTKLTMKYANDSTDVDSTAEREYSYANFSIDQYYSQKINLFNHDYTGTRLAEILGDENTSSPYCYVQGMGGVNTRFSFTNLQEWMDQNPLVINSATLVFDVVPEQESGIPYEDLPDRLMFGTILDDDSYEPIYDYYLQISTDDQAREFGGYKKAESKGLFSDTTYTYRFNMGLHFQSMVNGTKPDNDFILQLNDGLFNSKFLELWSNLSTNERRIRLELVYLKL